MLFLPTSTAIAIAVLDPPCPARCGHIHYGRCLGWRCNCSGER